jgi:hypothetical protein
VHFVGGGKVSGPRNDTSTHPAWRTALLHVVVTGYAGSPNGQSLRDLAPETGAYHNEVSIPIVLVCNG